MTDLKKQGLAAKKASNILRIADTETKNAAIQTIANNLAKSKSIIIEANKKDLEAAKNSGMQKAMLDRLLINEDRIDGMIESIKQIISLNDPIGQIDSTITRPNGLIIHKKCVPLGVIAIIYEARPNVTVDAATLCLKSGNVCILRGGSEAFNTNVILVDIIRRSLTSANLPMDCVSLVKDTSRETANELMHLNDYVDVLIPRGGAGLIRAVAKNASVPVIRTGEGVCHIYIDEDANIDIAAKVLYNAKCSRPSVCNAVECIVVNENIAEDFFAKAIPSLQADNVEFRCDEKALKILTNIGKPANEDDWDAEYDDYILAIKTVSNFDEAVDFINAHSTGHSESIITENYTKAQEFLNIIDAAAVYVNASTRFTDGGEFGLGAEIGISTQKMHARGPMGLSEMTSYKYVIYGNGQIR